MTNEELVKEVRGGKPELMAELYEQNKRFIFSLVKRIGIQADEYEDAMQNAYFGLYEAVQGYDESKGYKFLTYAKYYIQNAIQRGYNNTLHIPEYIYTAARKIKRKRDRLAQELNRVPTTAELSEYTGIDIKTITYILNTVKPVKSIYEPVSSDTEGLTVGDCIEDKTVTFENDIDAADEARYIRTVIDNTLTGAEKETVILFYFKGMTYTEIAELELKHLAAADVRKYISRGLRKLRQPRISKHLVDSYIDCHTPFYCHMGIKSFNTTWTSSTEKTVIEREYISNEIQRKLEIFNS